MINARVTRPASEIGIMTWELYQHAPGQSFFARCKSLGELLGCSYKTVEAWLKDNSTINPKKIKDVRRMYDAYQENCREFFIQRLEEARFNKNPDSI